MRLRNIKTQRHRNRQTRDIQRDLETGKHSDIETDKPRDIQRDL